MVKVEVRSELLLNSMTPERWCEVINHTHNVRLSPRSLRSLARKSGCFTPVGRNMLLSARHIDQIFEHRLEGPQQASRKPSNAQKI